MFCYYTVHEAYHQLFVLLNLLLRMNEVCEMNKSAAWSLQCGETVKTRCFY